VLAERFIPDTERRLLRWLKRQECVLRCGVVDPKWRKPYLEIFTDREILVVDRDQWVVLLAEGVLAKFDDAEFCERFRLEGL
jgi:hypothetical protein